MTNWNDIIERQPCKGKGCWNTIIYKYNLSDQIIIPGASWSLPVVFLYWSLQCLLVLYLSYCLGIITFAALVTIQCMLLQSTLRSSQTWCFNNNNYKHYTTTTTTNTTIQPPQQTLHYNYHNKHYNTTTPSTATNTNHNTIQQKHSTNKKKCWKSSKGVGGILWLVKGAKFIIKRVFCPMIRWLWGSFRWQSRVR